jgi:hypothetical protein
MIDRAVYTWVTGTPDGALGDAGWFAPGLHEWSWRCSTALARRAFPDSPLRLYTDARGSELLGHLFDEVEEVFGPEWDRRGWGVAKLLTHSVQSTPYIHLDGDFFLYDMPQRYREAASVVQCHETQRGYDRPLWSLRKHGVFASPSPTVYNVGCLGGCDVERLRRYASEGLATWEEWRAKDFFGELDLPRFANYFLEQYRLPFHIPPRDMTFAGPRWCFLRPDCSPTGMQYDHAVTNFRDKPEFFIPLITRVVTELGDEYQPFGDRASAFGSVFRHNVWGSDESVSGPGSERGVTEGARAAVASAIAVTSAKTLVDVGCGDVNWLDDEVIAGVSYTGLDIVEGVVAVAAKRWPRRSFRVSDAVVDDVGAHDLALVRDVVIHLPIEQVRLLVKNLRRNGVKWLLASTYPGIESRDTFISGYSQKNLEEPRFGLGTATALWRETLGGGEENRHLGLWRL